MTFIRNVLTEIKSSLIELEKSHIHYSLHPVIEVPFICPHFYHLYLLQLRIFIFLCPSSLGGQPSLLFPFTPTANLLLWSWERCLSFGHWLVMGQLVGRWYEHWSTWAFRNGLAGQSSLESVFKDLMTIMTFFGSAAQGAHVADRCGSIGVFVLQSPWLCHQPEVQSIPVIP